MKRIDLYQREIEKLRPFEGEQLKQIKAFYKNALEGNTLTESETKVILLACNHTAAFAA